MPALTPLQTFDLAVRYFQTGKLAESLDLCRNLLAAFPENPGALRLHGLVIRQSGALAEAAEWLRRACAANPGDAACQHDYGETLRLLGDYDGAVAAFRRALAIQPAAAEIHNNLGNALQAQGRMDEAIDAFRHAIHLAPNIAEIHGNLCSALRDRGRWDEAVSAGRRAVSLNPHSAGAHTNLGAALFDNDQSAEAAEAFRRALALQPDLVMARNNLGAALEMLDREEEAGAAYRGTLAIDPENLLALGNLAGVLHARGEIDAALSLYRQALDSPSAPASLCSNYLTVLQLSPEITPAQLFEAHAAYDTRYGQPLRPSWQPHANLRAPERPLRIGFVSPRFCFHPVGFFFVRALENLDPREFAAICYHDGPKRDAMSERLRAAAAEWHDVRGLPHDLLAQRIHDDRIDVLFDLAGHNVSNRLPVFARKPAPIQITWLDYVGTTGLAAMDYILADPRQIPPTAEPFYREKILRLPDDYICFDPPATAPAVSPLPALASGSITFASFNIVAKINQCMIELWSQILHRVPNSRLVLKNRRFDDPEINARYRQWFTARSIDPSRILFEGWSPRAEVLAAYHRVDIALDTLPYNGGLTTCEALWMGVPVITCPGEIFAGRHSLTHLTAAGFADTIARDLDDYVNLAVALATDLPRLATLRSSLRTRVASSPLCDGARFARNLSSLLREAWRRRCQQA